MAKWAVAFAQDVTEQVVSRILKVVSIRVRFVRFMMAVWCSVWCRASHLICLYFLLFSKFRKFRYGLKSGGFLQETKAPEVKLFWAELGQARQSPFADAFLGVGWPLRARPRQLLKDGTHVEVMR